MRACESDAPGLSVLSASRARVREGLDRVSAELSAAGMPVPAWEGKVIRPVVGLAAAVEAGHAPPSLWRALAAVQLAHEASLLHDDVIDGAAERRGRPTVAASRGVAAALVEGDHLLTSAYRLAAGVASPAWLELFTRAVERTVAGEKAQARSAGRTLDWQEYEALVLGKSGELMGAALAASPALAGEGSAQRHFELGRRVGLIYQMLDDLLDYCPHADTGKPALTDYRRGLWTWPRLFVDLPAGLEPDEVVRRLAAPGPGGRTALEACLERLRSEAAAVRREIGALLPGDEVLASLLDEWLDRAERAAERPRTELPPVAGWEALMAEHAKSFRFAARLFPADRREQVVGVYAWCRYTDDLVDGVDAPARELEARLDSWLALSRRAYEGERTGNALADRVMTEMRAAGVPFGYAEELIEGMRMDVRGIEYRTLAELRTYTFRVASVVGLWMTELFGLRDPWLLDRAAALGHAMQLTNILRDVGEDLEAGRLYLPTTCLEEHGLTPIDLERMAATGEIDARYRSLVERMLQVAESEYDHALPAIARLPGFYRRPVAVAADVYRGIHDEIRGNDYDNLTRRAYTRLRTKLRLGAGALIRSRTGVPALARAASLLALLATLLLVAPTASLAQEPGELDRPAVVPASRSVVTQPVARVEPAGRGPATERAFVALGQLWVQAVEDESAVAAGLEAVDRLRARLEPVSPDRDRLLRAYRGAFTTLRAKHGGWPRERLRNLRDGFALMDATVAEAPDAASLRYVRLMSGFYLPGLFGRGDEVDDDLAALVRLLPDARAELPPAVLPDVVRFVLEHGEPGPEDRRRLEELLP